MNRYFRQYHDEKAKEEISYEEAMKKLGRSFEVPEMLDLVKGVSTMWARYWMEASR